jgi:hypothetical protein
MYETSGVLKPAVEAYLNAKRLSGREVALLKLYLWQWVNSPVWAPSGALEALRLRVAAIANGDDVDLAVAAAEELGMDPL